VLIADDFQAFLDRIADLLSREFRVVGSVTNGAQLVDAAASLHPDVIVVDIYMPILNGLEAAVRIRDGGSQAPIVCMTAHHESELLDAAQKTGALGYVTKPNLAQDLVPAIRAALEGRYFVSRSALTD
jgi:DNA-binding NarL/FixJ family response regulator